MTIDQERCVLMCRRGRRVFLQILSCHPSNTIRRVTGSNLYAVLCPLDDSYVGVDAQMYLRGTLCMAALAGVVQSTSHICLAQSPMKSSDHLIRMIQKWIVRSTCEKCSGAPSPPNQLSSKLKCPPLTPLSPSYWPSRF